MKFKIKDLIIAAALAIVFAFVFVFIFKVFSKLFFESDIGFIGNAIGAFMGALFAFLLGRIGELLERVYERQKLNHNSLVKIEYALNSNIYLTGENLAVLELLLRVFNNDVIKEGKPAIQFNQVKQYQVEMGSTYNLSNLEFINEYAGFNIRLIRLNSNIEMLRNTYKDMKNHYLSTHDFSTYKGNVETLVKKLGELKQTIEKADNEAIDLLSKTQVLLEDKPVFTRFLQFLMRKNYTKEMKASFDKKKAEIKKERNIE